MDPVTPILKWNKETLTVLRDNCIKDVTQYEIASKATHVFLAFFGLASLTTFGMISPSYTATTSTLIILAYGPACEVTVESWKDLADKARRQAAKYQAILDQYEVNHSDVEGLENRPTLKAQWYALEPTPIDAYQPPPSIHSFKQGEEALAQRLNHLQSRMENAKKKIFQAYLLYVAADPFTEKFIADYGTFHEWRDEHLVMGVPFAFFNDLTLEDIERAEPKDLKGRIFTT